MNPRSRVVRARHARRRTGPGICTWLAGWLLLLTLLEPVNAGPDRRVYYNIEPQSADQALIEFARQSEVSVLFPTERINQITTHRLQGVYVMEEALDVLLRDTGLLPELSAPGVLAIKLSTTRSGDDDMGTTNRKTTGLAAMVASFTTALLGQSAAAQTGTGDTLSLEEVIVTAEKREVDLQKTAISIQVYSGEELQKQGKKRIDEIMSGVVGVQAQDGQVGQAFSMRGVETGAGPGGPGQNSGTTVAVLIDGIYQSRTETVRGGTLDVSQVEVMRGTQSTTLGANALAGAVSLVSNKPIFEYQANGSLTVGNYNLLNTEGVLNVPLTDNQALRVAYSTNKRDGYISSGAGDSDLKNARLKYRWRASDDFDIVGTISHQDIGGNGVTQGTLTANGMWVPYVSTTPACAAGVTTNPNCRIAVIGYPEMFMLVGGPAFRDRASPWNDGYPKDVWPNNPYADTKITSYSADINWNTGIGTLTVLPSYEHARFIQLQAPRGTGTNYMSQDRTQVTKQVDVRLASNDDAARLQWLTGAYYYDTFYSGPFTTILYPNDGMYATTAACASAIAGMSNCFTWTRDKESSTITTSVYGNATFSVTDALRVIGGLRYSKDKKVVENTLVAIAGSAIGPFTPYTYTRFPERTWSATSYRAGIEYDLLPRSMVYATLATGYQPGTVNAMTGVASLKNTSTQFTAGIKNRFFDNTLQFNVEAFLLEYKNRPFTYNLTTGTCSAQPPTNFTGLFVPSDYSCINPVGATVTVPKQESRGVDIELNYVPTAADRIDFTFEWLDATFGSPPAAPVYSVTDVTNAAGGTPNTTLAQQRLNEYNAYVTAYEGVTLQNAPKLSANLTYEHRFTFAGGSTLSPSVNVSYKSEYWGQGNSPAPAGVTVNPKSALDNGSILRQDAYSLWNAFLNWRNADGKFSATAFVKNIQNEAIQLNIGGEGPSTPNYVSLDAPRTFGLTLSASF